MSRRDLNTSYSSTRTPIMNNVFDIRVVEPTRVIPEPAVEFKGRIKLSKNVYKLLNLISAHRLISASLALLIFLGLLIPIASNNLTSSRYKLSSQAGDLLGSTSPKLAEKISYDSKTELYQYNKQNKPQLDKDGKPLPINPTDPSIAAGDRGYSADLYKDPSKGITLYDIVNNLSISFTPQFKTLGAKQDSNRLIYPINSKPGTMVYSAKANGVKEDIVLEKYSKDNLSFSYKLNLNSDLQARLNPDGSVGIYSADPSLYGNISFGSDEDRAKVEKARTNGKKDNLVFFIPAPIINEANQSNKPSNRKEPKAHFELKDNILTVKAENLKTASYPLSIDPTFVVTSAADWEKGNDEGIDFDSSTNSIKRPGLTGGGVGAWTIDSSTCSPSTDCFTTARIGLGTVAYNGYLYVLGGDTGNGQLTSNYFAPINSGGDVGTWAATSSFNTGRADSGFVAYNGYMYAIGGKFGGNTPRNTGEFAKINSDGTLGAWKEGAANGIPNLNTARGGVGSTVYNGYIYVSGGINPNPSSVYFNTTEYAQIKGDGTLSSWTQTTGSSNFNDDRSSMGLVAYNGYLYLFGGSDSGNHKSDTQVAKLGSDGSVGSWSTTTSLPSARSGFGYGVANGYIYLAGGCGGGACTSFLKETLYGQINSDGSIASWQKTSNLNTNHQNTGGAFYKGYFYITGGCVTGTPCNINDPGFTASNKTEYAKIDPVGSTGSGLTTTNLNTARWNNGTAVSKGYIYVTGGCTSANGGCTAGTANVEFAKINSDGSLGSWTSATNSLNSVRIGNTLIADQGRIYAIGGCSVVISSLCTSFLSTVESATTNDTTGQPSSWTTAGNNMNTPRYAAEAVIFNKKLYVIGGIIGNSGSDTTSTSSVEIASLDGGNPGSFTQSTPTNFTARSQFAIGVYNGRIYAAGGRSDGGGGIAFASYITINSDGTLASSWTSSSSLSGSGKGVTGFIDKGYFYVLGRSNASTNVDYAQINSDGSLSNFSLTNAMAAAVSYGHAVAANGYYYYPGGCVSGLCDGNTNVTKYGPINNGGSGSLASSWTTNSNSLQNSRFKHASVVSNGTIYVIGGCTNSLCSTSTAGIEYASLTSTGSIGSWASSSHSLPATRIGHSAVVNNGFLYVIGGTSGNPDVIFAKLPTSGGDLTSQTCPAGLSNTNDWCIGSPNFTTARMFFGATVYNNYLYISGGCIEAGCSTTPFLSDTQYTLLNSNGTLSGWNTAATSFTSGRHDHGMAAYNGYLYVVAGCTGSVAIVGCADSTAIASDVQFAKVNSDGSLNSDAGCGNVWCNGPSVGVARAAFGIAVYNGNLYIAGGANVGGAVIGTVEYAPIFSSGYIGSWQFTSNMTASTRWFGGLLISNGELITAGGQVGANPVSTVLYAGAQSIPRVGKYSRLLDCELDCTPTKLLARGTTAGTDSIVTNSYMCAPNSSSTFGSSTSNTLTLGSLLNITYQVKRYCWLSFTIDDTNSAVFPDSTQTSLSDFNLYYHPASSKRLRGGKTFTGGSQQSLDAQP